MKVGIIGYGYWGPNILRNFAANPDTQVAAVCDLSTDRLKLVKSLYPAISLHSDYKELTRNPQIDAVAVVTPVSTHYEIAMDALNHDKHVFIEKPIASSSAQSKALVDKAKEKNLTLMVDHTFLFTGAVRKIKEIIAAGDLGDIHFYDSVRINLGLFQHDINVVWDLAPHDIAVINHLLPHRPVAVSAIGQSCMKNDIEDIAYCSFFYEDNLIVHLNLSWMSPVKIRKTIIGGTKKMLVWDDLESDEKVKIYDKGVNVETKEGFYDILVKYRAGDMWSPQIDGKEALKLEIEYFVNCVRKGERPLNDGAAGHEVVRILEGLEKSIKNDGKRVTL